MSEMPELSDEQIAEELNKVFGDGCYRACDIDDALRTVAKAQRELLKDYLKVPSVEEIAFFIIDLTSGDDGLMNYRARKLHRWLMEER